MDMDSKKLRVAFFSEDFSRQAKGTAIVIQKLAEQFLTDFSGQIELTLIRKEGFCGHPLVKKMRNIEIKVYKTPIFSTLISYFIFFIKNKEEFDAIIFNRNVYPGFWLLNAKKYILFIYDAPVNQIYKENLSLENRLIYFFLKYIGKYFLDAMIAVSNDAKSGIIEYLNLNPSRVFTVYGGVGDEYRLFSDQEKTDAQAVLKEKYGIITPYILAVSRLEPHKNITTIIDSFFILKNQYNITHKLVIVGGRHLSGHTKMIEEKIANLNLSKDIIITSYIEENDMPAVYNLADLLIFPSLLEGFGLPVAEAMKCGTPVIASNLPVMAEVADGAAILVDSYNAELFATNALKILKNQKLEQELVRKGLERSKVFSWKNSVEQLFRIIKL